MPPGFNWRTELGRHWAAQLAAFGENLVIQQGSLPSVTIQGLRGQRNTLEMEGDGNYEAFTLDPAALPLPCASGQQVGVDGVNYVVINVSRPDPYGLVTVGLSRR
jgi:hypothetical protein